MISLILNEKNSVSKFWNQINRCCLTGYDINVAEFMGEKIVNLRVRITTGKVKFYVN